MESEWLDSQSGAQVAAFVVASTGSRLEGGGMTKMSHAKRAIRKWVGIVSEELDKILDPNRESSESLKKEFDGLKGDVNRAFTGIGDPDGRTESPPEVDASDEPEESPGSPDQ